MADIVRAQGAGFPLEMETRLVDIGEGTHAPIRLVVLANKGADGAWIPEAVTTTDSGILVVTALADYRVGTGERFKTSFVQPHGGELANDASQDFLIRVGSKHIRARARVATGGGSELLMYEGPTNTDVGVVMPVLCKNRCNPGTSEVLAYVGPTITGVGTPLFNWFVPGGSRGATVGGSWSESDWMLASNTDYLFRVTNRSGGVIQLSFSLGWSERE